MFSGGCKLNCFKDTLVGNSLFSVVYKGSLNMKAVSCVRQICWATILPYVIHFFKITETLSGNQGPISKS